MEGEKKKSMSQEGPAIRNEKRKGVTVTVVTGSVGCCG